MSYKHLKSLLFKSGSIQQRIELEQRGKHPDRMRLLQMKILRLSIHDRLQRFIFARSGDMRLAPVSAISRRFPRSA
jgi:hypothetical protein